MVKPKDVAIDSTLELSRRQSVGVAVQHSKYSLSKGDGDERHKLAGH